MRRLVERLVQALGMKMMKMANDQTPIDLEGQALQALQALLDAADAQDSTTQMILLLKSLAFSNMKLIQADVSSEVRDGVSAVVSALWDVVSELNEINHTLSRTEILIDLAFER